MNYIVTLSEGAGKLAFCLIMAALTMLLAGTPSVPSCAVPTNSFVSQSSACCRCRRRP